MKNKHVKTNYKSILKRGKVKLIGFFERIPLVIAGRKDGRRGLPRKNVGGQWLSPHMEKEIRAYHEFATNMWGRLQIEEKAAFSQMEKLIGEVEHLRDRVDQAAGRLSEATKSTGDVCLIRRPGESKLTDAQVAARRAHERDKKLSPLRGRLSALQAEYDAAIDECLAVRAKIVEENNATRMVCHRLRDHLYQRLAVYWNAVLRTHVERSDMPAVPDVEIAACSEEAYLSPHQELLKRVETLCQTTENKHKEVA